MSSISFSLSPDARKSCKHAKNIRSWAKPHAFNTCRFTKTETYSSHDKFPSNWFKIASIKSAPNPSFSKQARRVFTRFSLSFCAIRAPEDLATLKFNMSLALLTLSASLCTNCSGAPAGADITCMKCRFFFTLGLRKRRLCSPAYFIRKFFVM